MTNAQTHRACIQADSEGSFYALIVRIDRDGEEHVIRGYKGRHFVTHKAAVKSTSNYMMKWELN